MFTVRFISHHSKEQYKSYACRAYNVRHTDSGECRLTMWFPDGESYEEQVGPDAPYETAYVTNLDSRTIDVLRARFN